MTLANEMGVPVFSADGTHVLLSAFTPGSDNASGPTPATTTYTVVQL